MRLENAYEKVMHKGVSKRVANQRSPVEINRTRIPTDGFYSRSTTTCTLDSWSFRTMILRFLGGYPGANIKIVREPARALIVTGVRFGTSRPSILTCAGSWRPPVVQASIRNDPISLVFLGVFLLGFVERDCSFEGDAWLL